MKTSKPWLYAALRAMDRVGARLVKPVLRTGEPPAEPRKILVANTAHLGDVLLSTGVPSALRALFPEAEVHFLASSRAAALLRGHGEIARVHVYDSLLLNWASPPAERVVRWARTLMAAFRALRAEGYDIAVELRSYFPNVLPLLRLARPRFLVGFGTGGLRFILDHEVPRRAGVHETERFQDVVAALAQLTGVGTAQSASVDPQIEYLVDAGAALKVLERLGLRRGEPYSVLHPGTTRPRKRWPEARWRRLAQALSREAVPLVVTGAARERRWLEAMFAGLPVRIAAGLTELGALAGLFRGAAWYVGVDSFASHLAALAGTPRVIVLWSRYGDPVEWRPRGVGEVLSVPAAAGPEEVCDLCLAVGAAAGC